MKLKFNIFVDRDHCELKHTEPLYKLISAFIQDRMYKKK